MKLSQEEIEFRNSSCNPSVDDPMQIEPIAEKPLDEPQQSVKSSEYDVVNIRRAIEHERSKSKLEPVRHNQSELS
jgi:hypothetical protein